MSAKGGKPETDLIHKLILQDKANGVLQREIALKYGITEKQVSLIVNKPENKKAVIDMQTAILAKRQEQFDRYIEQMTDEYMKITRELSEALLEGVKEARSKGEKFVPDTIIQRKKNEIIQLKKAFDLQTRAKLYTSIMRPFFDNQKEKQ